MYKRQAFFIDRVVVVGEARFLRWEFDEVCIAAFCIGTRGEFDLVEIVDFVIRSARPDGVRGVGVADDRHGGYLL